MRSKADYQKINAIMMFVSFPRQVSADIYRRAIAKLVEYLHQIPGFVSLYQIGSVSEPGISDLDVLAVFENGHVVSVDPRRSLNEAERYLFAHGLFGIDAGAFASARALTCFHNYRVVCGRDLADENFFLPEEDQERLQRQIALEYLVRMWIAMTVESYYQTVKIRNLLLQGKALAYDLEFLGITSGGLYDQTQRLLEFRAGWFKSQPTTQELAEWFRVTYEEVRRLLGELLTVHKIFLIPRRSYNMGQAIELTNANELSTRCWGLRLPRSLAHIGKPYFALQNRLNRFRFAIPFSTDGASPIVARHLSLQQQLRQYNDAHLPHFLPLATSLTVDR